MANIPERKQSIEDIATEESAGYSNKSKNKASEKENLLRHKSAYLIYGMLISCAIATCTFFTIKKFQPEKSVNTAIAKPEIYLPAKPADLNKASVEDKVIAKYVPSTDYSPEYYEYIVKLAMNYNKSGNYSTAIALLGLHTNDLYNKSHQLWYTLGNAYHLSSKEEEAGFCYEKSLQLNPTYADALNSLVTLYSKENRKTDTLLKLQNYIEKGGEQKYLSPDAQEFAKKHMLYSDTQIKKK